MNVSTRSSFDKDISRVSDTTVLRYIDNLFDRLENAESLKEIPNIKSLRGFPGYYRIRIGDYRLGFRYDGRCVVLIRFLHRKDIYRYFP